MKWKKFLAREILRRYHNEVDVKNEQEWFENTFSKKITPDDIPVLEVCESQWVAIDLVKKYFNKSKSNSELRRLFEQGAVSFNDRKISAFDEKINVVSEDVIKVGKRTWFKVRVEGK